jgi:hypothetical protein
MHASLAAALVLLSAGADAAEDVKNYDTLVVAPPALVEAMRPWFAHRVAQGRKIGLLTKCDSAEQIRVSIRNVAKHGKITHVLLVGDDHPDRAKSAELAQYTLPSATIKAKVNVHWGSEATIATDNWYADLDDDHVPDVAIGRLSADSPEQLGGLIRKIVDYETSPDHGPWRRRVNFITGAGNFGVVADTALDLATKKFITGKIPAGYQTTLTYTSLKSPYCPDPRRLPQSLLERHNEGCLFWVYIGHGQRRWLNPMLVDRFAFPLLDVDDARRMEAASGSPIAVFLACYTGAFDERDDCLAEEMLAAPRGPVAAICGSRMTMPYANAVLGHALLTECFEHDHATLGEVLLCAKRSAASNESQGADRQILDALATAISPVNDQLADERLEHMSLYNLLGDPLLRLARPQPVELKVPSSADAGEEIEIAGTCAVSGRCTVELVCRRDRTTFAAPRRSGFKVSDESLKALDDVYVYARANDQRYAAIDANIIEGRLQTKLYVPETCTGHCHVRVFVEGTKDFAIGAADIYVRPKPTP